MNIKEIRIGQGVKVEAIGVVVGIDTVVPRYPSVKIETKEGTITVLPQYVEPYKEGGK